VRNYTLSNGRCVEDVHAGQIWGTYAELMEAIEASSQLAPMRIVNGYGMQLLTRQEEEVAHLVTEGLQNPEIAKEPRLEPVINFIPLESKKYPSAPLSLTIGGWETRGKSAIPAM
jgi:hypothetical protein